MTKLQLGTLHDELLTGEATPNRLVELGVMLTDYGGNAPWENDLTGRERNHLLRSRGIDDIGIDIYTHARKLWNNQIAEYSVIIGVCYTLGKVKP